MHKLHLAQINANKVFNSRLSVLFAILLVGVAFFVAFSSSARVQEKTKRTVSKTHFHSKWITPPVEYSDLKIRGKQSKFSSMFEEGNERLQKALSPEMEFEEDDDFWEHLSFDVTNVSDKTIVFIRTYVFMYTKEGIRSHSRQSGASIDFGNPFPPAITSLKPGESKTLTLDPVMLDHVRQKVQQLTTPVVRIGIFADSVYYDDGYRWGFDGKVFPPKPQEKQSNLKNQTGTESKVWRTVTISRAKKTGAA